MSIETIKAYANAGAMAQAVTLAYTEIERLKHKLDKEKRQHYETSRLAYDFQANASRPVRSLWIYGILRVTGSRYAANKAVAGVGKVVARC